VEAKGLAQCLPGLQLLQSHTVPSRSCAADELLDKLPSKGFVSNTSVAIQITKQETPVF
jgi:hypothetical protein